MLNFSPEKLFLVGLIALMVLGPNRLPQAARTLGRFMSELRRMSASFQDEVRGSMGEPAEAFHSAISDFRPMLDLSHSMRDAITTTLVPPTSSGPVPPTGPRPTPDPSIPLAMPGPLVAPDDPSLN
jgi:sec-independent protein translocase protein TatB